MATQTRMRTVKFLTWLAFLFLLLSGILYWQAIGTDLSNPHANLWRMVRAGVPSYTSTPAQGHTILIQNGGENWREFRNGFLIRYYPWIIILALVAMAIFYLSVGKDKLERPRSGVKIERFTINEQLLHWYTALLFIIMAVTGLSLLLGRVAFISMFGHPVISRYLLASKVLHNYSGPLLLVGILLEFIVWVRYNIPKKIDLQWFKSMGGLFGKGPRPHSEKINGGEKAWFWAVVVFSIVVGLTGIVLDFPIWGQSRLVMQVSHVIHVVVAVLFVTASFGHIYMGTIGNEGAFEGMWTGSVDAVWAQQHQDLWYDEMMQAKKVEADSK